MDVIPFALIHTKYGSFLLSRFIKSDSGFLNINTFAHGICNELVKDCKIIGECALDNTTVDILFISGQIRSW